MLSWTENGNSEIEEEEQMFNRFPEDNLKEHYEEVTKAGDHIHFQLVNQFTRT